MTAPLAMRPYLPKDAPRCAAIFRASIEELAADDYDEEQRAAWANRADDEADFAANLAGSLTLIAQYQAKSSASPALRGPISSTCSTSIRNSRGAELARLCSTPWRVWLRREARSD
jgi:hypothetical protein